MNSHNILQSEIDQVMCITESLYLFTADFDLWYAVRCYCFQHKRCVLLWCHGCSKYTESNKLNAEPLQNHRDPQGLAGLNPQAI